MDSKTEELIKKFCKIVLTKADYPDYNGSHKFIKELTPVQKTMLSRYSNVYAFKMIVFPFIQNCVFIYLDSYKSGNNSNLPFSFDNSNFFQEYQNDFKQRYNEVHHQDPPDIFIYIFDYIKEVSTQYTFFEKFIEINDRKNRELAEILIQDSKDELTEAAVQAAEEIRVEAKAAELYAKEAATRAKDAAKEQVKTEVNNKMADVTSKVSETSVTILGIFAAIVLTVVADLFYSSSVISNINQADFSRLVCVASLVGVVCIDLIISLFYFIEKIKYPSLHFHHKNLIVILNIVLFALVFIFGFDSIKNSKSAISNDGQHTSESSTMPDETEQSEHKFLTFTNKNIISFVIVYLI